MYNKILYQIFSFTLFLGFLLLQSCNYEKNNIHRIVLEFDSIKSTVKNWDFVEMSKMEIAYRGDSIFIEKFFDNKNLQNVFINKNGNVYELGYYGAILLDEEENIIEDNTISDTILMFSVNDTTFIWNCPSRIFPPFKRFSPYFDSKYTIEKSRNGYKTIRQSLVDSTYKEIYFYNKNYIIYKFINTYKDNKCVYSIKNGSYRGGESIGFEIEYKIQETRNK